MEPWAVLVAISMAALMLGVVSSGRPAVAAGRVVDLEGHPKVYTLALGGETVSLDPGKPWIRTDVYKWSTRGLVEEPQSFHVLPNGSVEINGEHIPLEDPEGVQRLEREINKHHDLSQGGSVGKGPVALVTKRRAPPPPSDHVRFRVHVDHLNHLCVEAYRGEERSETSLRGLPGFVQNGLLLPLPEYHVDPLQRAVEIEGVRYEATEAGAVLLEQLLNSRFAAPVRQAGDRQISIRENPASSSGFDIRFVTVHRGMRLEVKGHLNQQRLDILQDPSKCDLLREGILVRLIPPLLLFRRKRPDSGEDRVPDAPDVAYRRVSAARLQEVFNNPAIRKGDLPPSETPPSAPAEGVQSSTADSVQAAPPTVVKPPSGPESPAVQTALPRPPEVATPNHPGSPAATMAANPADAGQICDPGPIVPGPGNLQSAEVKPGETQPAEEDEDVNREARLETRFESHDPLHVHDAIFRHLHRAIPVELQDLRLSLPRVFEHRRFEILSFSHPSVSDIGEIRCEDFYGFYLSHVEPRDLLLVYACAGCHMEWGAHRCVLQSSLRAEAEEYPGSALRGLLQDSSGAFVFVVTAPFRSWVRLREGECRRALLRFITVHELASSVDDFTFIWPER